MWPTLPLPGACCKEAPTTWQGDRAGELLCRTGPADHRGHTWLSDLPPPPRSQSESNERWG